MHTLYCKQFNAVSYSKFETYFQCYLAKYNTFFFPDNWGSGGSGGFGSNYGSDYGGGPMKGGGGGYASRGQGPYGGE